LKNIKLGKVLITR